MSADGAEPRHPHLDHLKQQVDAEVQEARRRAHDARDRVRVAAIEAELETGRREETLEEARAGVVRRTIRICVGSAVLLVGVVLVVLPGPGLLVVALGLGLLARDVVWAERLLVRLRRRLPQDADGRVPKPMIATGVAVALAAATASIWLTLDRPWG